MANVLVAGSALLSAGKYISAVLNVKKGLDECRCCCVRVSCGDYCLLLRFSCGCNCLFPRLRVRALHRQRGRLDTLEPLLTNIADASSV